MKTSELHHNSFLLDWDQIVDRKLSKKRLASHHYPPQKFTIDYALPQAWLDDVAEAAKAGDDPMSYADILYTTVWLYPDKSESPAFWLCGIPAVLCEDTARLLAHLNIAFWTPRGYHGAKL